MGTSGCDRSPCGASIPAGGQATHGRAVRASNWSVESIAGALWQAVSPSYFINFTVAFRESPTGGGEAGPQDVSEANILGDHRRSPSYSLSAHGDQEPTGAPNYSQRCP